MQRQSSHAGRGVEGLGHRDKPGAGRVEPVDELRKVGEGTGQSVDLVDHNPVDETGIDVVEQALQARALQGSSRATTPMPEVACAPCRHSCICTLPSLSGARRRDGTWEGTSVDFGVCGAGIFG